MPAAALWIALAGAGAVGDRMGGEAARTRVVITWGLNASGQLGRPTWGPDGAAGVPHIVPALASEFVERVACGAAFCVALARHAHSAALWGWGSASEGQLGEHAPRESILSPRVLPFTRGTPIVDVAAGRAHVLALRHEGVVLAWGSNARLQLGSPSAAAASTAPVVAGVPAVGVSVAAGADFSLATDEDGNVWAWGENAEGELGQGAPRADAPADGWPPRASASPLRVNLPGRAVHVAAGNAHALALVLPRGRAGEGLPRRREVELWSWGRDDARQLGARDPPPRGADAPTQPQRTNGTTLHVAASGDGGGPARVRLPRGFVADALACGPRSGVVLSADRTTALAWGDDAAGILSRDSAPRDWRRADTGGRGAGMLAMAGLPANLSADAHAIALGESLGAAAAANGALYTWGAAGLLAEGHDNNSGGGGRRVARRVRAASSRFHVDAVSCGAVHCAAIGACAAAIDACGVCAGDDSSCVLATPPRGRRAAHPPRGGAPRALLPAATEALRLV